MRKCPLLILMTGLIAASAQTIEKTQARLVIAQASAAPGATVTAGIYLRLPAGWHTYWRNPGDSGMPGSIQWTLPPGIRPGKIEWPHPAKLTEAGLTTYVYYRETMLLVPLTLATNLAPGVMPLEAKVSWLECKETCVPAEARLQAALTVANAPRLSPDAALIEAWQKRLPAVANDLPVRAWWEDTGTNDLRRLAIAWSTPAVPTAADFYPYAADGYEVQAETEKTQPGKDTVLLKKLVKKSGPEWPAQVHGLLVLESTAGLPETAYEARLSVAAAGGSNLPVSPPGLPVSDQALLPAGSLISKLGLAFLGGLILNIMPCVLPVLALKILSFVSQSKQAPQRVRALGIVYAAGVLTSFLALAALVIGVKAAGHKAGWGMQFGNPEFLVAITVLVTLVALNLFGLFEVNSGGGVMNTAGKLTAKEGPAGAFFNGVLATILATPCTAPFLAGALGFAFTQSPPVIVLVFLIVGVGLALPCVVLSWHPAWLKFLPKPGPWMEKFKVAMGFPMLATAVWLFGLTPLHYGRRVWWLGLFLVVLAAAAWVFGEFYQRGLRHRSLALCASLFLTAAGFWYALETQLDWRSPMTQTIGANEIESRFGGIPWQQWTPAAVVRARAEGRPILVDFTADWCLTCQVNKKTSVEVPLVQATLKKMNAVALLGDYTTVPDVITTELNRFGRAGVPLVLVYPRQADLPPIILPEILTPQVVLNALHKAVQ